MSRAWTSARVTAVETIATDVRLITLVPMDGGGVTSWPVGAHIEVEIPLHDRLATRRYSLIGRGTPDGAWRIAVKAVEQSRGGSRHMHGLGPGDMLRVSDPVSHFDLGRDRPEYLLIAGGIGVTPLVGMAEALVTAGVRVRMVYAARSRAHMAFGDHLAALLGDRLQLFGADQGERLDIVAEIGALDPQAEVYVCGPVGLMEAVQDAWRMAGRPAVRLRLETFGSSGHRPAEPFEVWVEDHGRSVTVATDVSLLDALAECGVEVASDCRRGECGLCAVKILKTEGEIDHRDVFLSERQKARREDMCICVSRAVGAIAIDTGYRAAIETR